MGRPGPAPKPVELKILEGNPGRRPLPNNHPKPQPMAPKIPYGIHPRARKFWRAHGPKLERLGILSEVDGPALAMLATHWAIAFEAARVIREEGLSAVDVNGATRKHPLLQVLRDNSTAFRLYAAEFGLTPSARGKLDIPEPTDDDEFFGF
jgi:P27 family predicted phage terminase small subunit